MMKARSVLWGLVAGLLVASLGAAETATLTILHTNDTHGHLRPFSYPGLVAPGSDLAELSQRSDIGGIARRAALVKRVREEQRSKGGSVWLIDAGDFSEGTPFSTAYQGEADIAAMNAAGYDFATLGNHEFSSSLAQLKALIAQARYPIVCANAIDRASGRPLGGSQQIAAAGGVRVGLFGLVTRDASSYRAALEGVTIADEIETARKVVAELRGQADVIVLISHCGDELDQQLAQSVRGIDVIVGGHSHSRLPVGQLVWHSDDLEPNNVNGTIIVQAHQWAGELGRLDLLFARDGQGPWRVERYRARLMPVTSAIPADPDVTGVVDRYWKPIAQRFDEVIGQATGDFTARGDDRAEYNLVADALRETCGTEIALDNMGGVRAPLIKGTITRADLVAMDPFNNQVVTFSISGRELRKLLKEAAPAVSGLRYRLEGGVVRQASVSGAPIQDRRMYRACSQSYFMGRFLPLVKSRSIGRLRLDVLVDYVRRKGTVRPAYDGRRVVVPGP